MSKKILVITLTVVMMISLFTNVYAMDNFFNMGAFETAYRLSNEAGISLPFINIFTKSATYDEIVKHSGISIGESTIDIDEKLEGVHLIMSNDMISIKGEVEHGIIYGTNIVIEGKISGDTVLIANKINILDNAVIERDVVVVADEMNIAGTVKGNLIGAISKINITGTIEDDLRVDTYDINLDGGNLEGNIYISVLEQGKVVGIKEKYPNAVVEEKVAQAETKISSDKIASIVFNGCKTVCIYTLVGWLLTRKDKNIISKSTNRFVENPFFGVALSTALLMLSILVVILLIILGALGLGVVAWPILIAYIAIILLSISISSFVVGITIYQVLKEKLGNYKLAAMIGIFAVIYTLTQITPISLYVVLAINLISLAIIMTLIFKKSEKEVIEASQLENDK